jgi:hypothetical protein
MQRNNASLSEKPAQCMQIDAGPSFCDVCAVSWIVPWMSGPTWYGGISPRNQEHGCHPHWCCVRLYMHRSINVSSNHTLAVASHPNAWTVLYVRYARDNEIVAHLSGVYCKYVYVVHGQNAPHHVCACVLFSTYPANIEALFGHGLTGAPGSLSFFHFHSTTSSHKISLPFLPKDPPGYY